ncbi:MAG: sensor histidine kinase [Candidatus Solibacter sp.]|nr:sensor histidine kinase [Candidatus Solibacter sp.]
MEQQIIILLVKLAVAASFASILSRSSRFLNLLLREDRTTLERLQIALGIAVFCATGASFRLSSGAYLGADLSLEGSIVAGIVGGYISGLVAGAACALPAMLSGEFLSMPLYAAVGVIGGLLRDLAPRHDEIWRFSPFFDLSIYRLIRYPSERQRRVYHILVLVSLLLAELLRFLASELFQGRYLFTPYAMGGGFLITSAAFLTTVFAVTIPLKVWNSARNERLLESKERLLVQARLSALSSQINPHFLFNTLNTVSSLIRTRPEEARRVVHRLSSILRRLLRKTDSFTPLRDEIQFIDDYLSIETVRFGDKLKVVKEIDPAALDAQIPAMLLQPIVENSIRHGLANQVHGGQIRLAVQRSEPGRVQLIVEDDGAGIEESRLATLLEQAGIGVSNVNERLHVLFGDNYRLTIDSRPGHGTRTEIDIPVR